jgi:cytosine/adenosine deaminase-related metal-dependent hydrolase
MTLICADWVISEPGREPLSDGAVRVVDGQIVAVGPSRELRAAHADDDLVDASGQVLAPGFVNTHVHLYGVLAHGIPLAQAPSGFWPFLEDFWWPKVEDALDRPMILAATAWVGAELLRSGTTTFYDILEAPNALPGVLVDMSHVVEGLGLRGVLSFEATQRQSEANAALGLEENLAMIDHGRTARSLVGGLMCIHTTFTCSPSFIERAFAAAEERDVLLHAHVNEGTHEAELCLQRYGKRTLELYDALGVAGPRLMASQCVQLSQGECDIIAERGVRVTHMPLSNCEVGGGIAPVPELVQRGVTVGLGSDGYLNDMFQVMRAATLIHKARLCDPQVMPAAEVFRLATVGGADALGLGDRIGRLAPGYRADLQLIDASFPTPASAHNLYDQLVLWRSGHDVRSVMVDGVWRVRNGAVIDFDLAAAHAHLGEQARRLWTHS